MTPLVLQTAANLAQASESEDPVAAGRDALSEWGRYPWYDADSDQLQPIDLSEPRDWSWLTDWVNFNAASTSGSWSGLQVLAWVLIFVVFVAAAWFLFRAYRRRKATVVVQVDTQEQTGEEERRRYEALPDGVRPRTGLLEEARRCYESGNYNEAVIYLFSHQLVCLDRNHRIRLARGKTNRQYLRELAGDGALNTLLAQTIVVFEDVFFGGRSIDRSRFETCWGQLPRFEALAGGEVAR